MSKEYYNLKHMDTADDGWARKRARFSIAALKKITKRERFKGFSSWFRIWL